MQSDIALGIAGGIMAMALGAVGSGLGTGAAASAAIGAWKRCYAQGKQAPFILLSYVVVGSCTLWLVIPGTALAPLFSVVAGFAARAQNELIRAAAALPAAALDIRLTTTQCWSVYGLFIFATLLLWSAERKKSVSSLPE